MTSVDFTPKSPDLLSTKTVIPSFHDPLKELNTPTLTVSKKSRRPTNEKPAILQEWLTKQRVNLIQEKMWAGQAENRKVGSARPL